MLDVLAPEFMLLITMTYQYGLRSYDLTIVLYNL